MEFEISNITLEEIAERLKEWPPEITIRKEWKALIDNFEDKTFGEIRQASELTKIPGEQTVRVAYVIDDQGPVLRFLANGGPACIPMCHDSLLGECEEKGKRYGNIIRRNKNIIICKND